MVAWVGMGCRDAGSTTTVGRDITACFCCTQKRGARWKKGHGKWKGFWAELVPKMEQK